MAPLVTHQVKVPAAWVHAAGVGWDAELWRRVALRVKREKVKKYDLDQVAVIARSEKEKLNASRNTR